MTEYIFNSVGARIAEGRDYDATLIEATPNLRRASLHHASLFGGPLIREALTHCPLYGDRLNVIVDTKVSYLMPGWSPAIPGWHTDGVPRKDSDGYSFDGVPSMDEQARGNIASPRFHTLIVGNPCLTEFVGKRLKLELGDAGETRDLYSVMDRQVRSYAGDLHIYTPEVGQWVSWNWWNIHQATPATKTGWRLLIRVTESVNVRPAESDFIRAQNQVYVPQHFGW